jgi:hypothetical protein
MAPNRFTSSIADSLMIAIVVIVLLVVGWALKTFLGM